MARREFTFDTIPLPDGPADAVDSPAADALASDAFFVAFDEYRVRETRGPGFEQAFAVRKSVHRAASRGRPLQVRCNI